MGQTQPVFWQRHKMSAAKLICGLGNPGREYENHRHNIGFRVVDVICRRSHASLDQQKFEARIGQGRIGDQRALFLQPQTFMNSSGSSVAAAMRFYKIGIEQLLVIHDELDLPFGRLQLKAGGGAGGHNGLKSLIDCLASEDFARLRFGIGKPEGFGAKDRVVGYVLSGFGPEERKSISELVDRAADAVDAWCREGLAIAMNRFNRREQT